MEGNPIPIGYSTFNRELLAAYLSVLHFRHLIEGRQVLLLTDHKPLCGAFYSLNPVKSDRQQRQLAILTEFISDTEHVKGSQNIVADCLSRPTLAVQIDACDLPALAEVQASDTEIQSFQDLKDSPYLEITSLYGVTYQRLTSDLLFHLNCASLYSIVSIP